VEGFRVNHLREIERLMKTAEMLTEQRNFSDAFPRYQKLDSLLPAERFTFEQAGVVIDNAKGVMWVRDGNSAGCNGGRKLGWYEALKWISTLSFAGHGDWQLPTEEDLRVIVSLSSAERGKAFPNNKAAKYWTKVPAQNVDKALAVDFKAGKTVREPKSNAHHVRALRFPK